MKISEVSRHGEILVESVDSAPPVSTIVQNEPDRLDWKLNAAIAPGATAEIQWWNEPGSGTSSSSTPVSSARSPKEIASGWSLHRTPLADDGRFLLRLPFSPFWPQQSRASAVVRITRKPDPKIRVPFLTPVGSGPLPEVRPSHRDEIVEETLVLDDWLFHRRRSWPEKLGWVLALGVAPIVVLGGAGRKVGLRFNRPRLAMIFAVVAIVCLYTLTPVGAALGRVLGEF
jgi:hypothetical protein